MKKPKLYGQWFVRDSEYGVYMVGQVVDEPAQNLFQTMEFTHLGTNDGGKLTYRNMTRTTSFFNGVEWFGCDPRYIQNEATEHHPNWLQDFSERDFEEMAKNMEIGNFNESESN